MNLKKRVLKLLCRGLKTLITKIRNVPCIDHDPTFGVIHIVKT